RRAGPRTVPERGSYVLPRPNARDPGPAALDVRPRGLQSSSVLPEVPIDSSAEAETRFESFAGSAGREFEQVHRGRQVLQRHELRLEAAPRPHVVVVPEGDRE